MDVAQEQIQAAMDLARSVAIRSGRYLPSDVVDDLIAAGYLGVAKAARSYDADHASKSSFAHFAYPSIHGEIMNEFQRVRCRGFGGTKRLMPDVHLPLRLTNVEDPSPGSVGFGDVADTRSDPVDAYLEWEDEFESWLRVVPEPGRSVLRLRYMELDGRGNESVISHIAQRLGMTENRVLLLHTNAIQRIREKLEGARQ